MRSERVRGRPRAQVATPHELMAAKLRAAVQARDRITFPSKIYEGRIVEFFEEILGVEVWAGEGGHAGMLEMVEAIQRDKVVALKAGRRCSKSITLVGIALWIFATYEHGQAVLISNTAAQLKTGLWKELRALHARSGICLACRKAGVTELCEHSSPLDGVLGETHESGLKDPNPARKRFIIGRVGRTPEAYQGLGSPTTAILCDEAALIADDHLAAIEGTNASGGWLVLAGNPRKTGNAFHRAFSPGSGYSCVTVPSTATPNYQRDAMVIEGLASRAWVDAKIKLHGKNSAYVATHVAGEFPSASEMRPFHRARLDEAEQRNETNPPHGLLHIGLDPASYGSVDGRNDQSVITVRRGLKVYEQRVFDQLNEEEILAELLAVIDQYGQQGEVPILNLDAEGTVGWTYGNMLRAHLSQHPKAFDLWRIRASEPPKRDKQLYERQRDALLGNFDLYLQAGGGIPEDPTGRLAEELELMEWTVNARGRSKAQDKVKLRKLLGRSPDRADSLLLACWQAPGTAFDAPPKPKRPPQPAASQPMRQAMSGRGGRASLYGDERSWRR